MLQKILNLASKADALPDASKLKTWSEICFSLLTAPTSIIATAVGGSLAFFQWYLPYKEAESKKRVIQRSPVHVEVTVNARPVANLPSIIGGTEFTPVVILVAAKNTTSREFAIINSKFAVLGVIIKPNASKDDLISHDHGQDVAESASSTDFRKYYSEQRTLVASGDIFRFDSAIRPSETLRQSLVVYTRKNSTNYLRIQITLPIIASSTEKYLEDKFNLKPIPSYRHIDTIEEVDWKLCPMKRNASVDTNTSQKALHALGCNGLNQEEKTGESQFSKPKFNIWHSNKAPAIDESNYLLSFTTIDLPLKFTGK